MEACSPNFHRARFSPTQQPLNPSSSPPNHRRSSYHRHHGGAGDRSAMRFSSYQRITSANLVTIFLKRSRPLQIPFALTSATNLDLSFDFNFKCTMADSGANKETQPGGGLSVIKDTKETEKSLEEIPPPPEKPLPGDCCGSGCVRCVWDVYYDELEEYNNLYKGKSDSTIGSKAS